MSSSKKVVWFHKVRGIAWGVFGLVSFIFGWQNNIALVWFASVYANALTDWGAGEAADDRALQEQMNRIEQQNAEILELLKK